MTAARIKDSAGHCTEEISADLTACCALQAALASCAVSPITLLVISIADFSKHATPEVLRVMRDEVRLVHT